MRHRARAFAAAKGTGWRHFMSGFLGIEKGREAPDGVIAGSGPVGRRCRGAPVMDASDADMVVALCLGEASVKIEGSALFGEIAPEPTVKRHIACHIIAQHVRSPGQG